MKFIQISFIFLIIVIQSHGQIKFIPEYAHYQTISLNDTNFRDEIIEVKQSAHTPDLALTNKFAHFTKNKNDTEYYNTSNSFSISCKELIEYVKLYGDNIQSLDALRLSSSWLKEVKAYEVNDKIVVIAQIYKGEVRIATMEYIYCDIPRRNWDKFYEPIFNTNLTYGEKFHEYINPFKCDCE